MKPKTLFILVCLLMNYSNLWSQPDCYSDAGNLNLITEDRFFRQGEQVKVESEGTYTMPGQSVTYIYHSRKYNGPDEMGQILRYGTNWTVAHTIHTVDTIYCTIFIAELLPNLKPDFNDECLAISKSISLYMIPEIEAAFVDCDYSYCTSKTKNFRFTGGLPELFEDSYYSIQGEDSIGLDDTVSIWLLTDELVVTDGHSENVTFDITEYCAEPVREFYIISYHSIQWTGA